MSRKWAYRLPMTSLKSSLKEVIYSTFTTNLMVYPARSMYWWSEIVSITLYGTFWWYTMHFCQLPSYFIPVLIVYGKPVGWLIVKCFLCSKSILVWSAFNWSKIGQCIPNDKHFSVVFSHQCQYGQHNIYILATGNFSCPDVLIALTSPKSQLATFKLTFGGQSHSLMFPPGSYPYTISNGEEGCNITLLAVGQRSCW